MDEGSVARMSGDRKRRVKMLVAESYDVEVGVPAVAMAYGRYQVRAV